MQEPTDTGTYTPPSPSYFAAPADQRGASTDIGQTFSNFGSAIHDAPVLGGALQYVKKTVDEGLFSSTILGRDPRFEGLQQGTPEFQQAQQDRIQGLGFGILGPEAGGAGKIAKELGTAAESAGERYAPRLVPGTKSMYEVFDATTGANAGGVVHSTEAAAESRAAKLNAKAATEAPAAPTNIAGASDAFNQAAGVTPEAQAALQNAVAVDAAARKVPEYFKSVMRGQLRSGTELTPETLLGTSNVTPLLNKALREAGVSLSDANRSALAQQLIDNQVARNEIIAKSPKSTATARAKAGLPEEMNAETLSQRIGAPNTPAQQAQNGVLARAIEDRRAGIPGEAPSAIPPEVANSPIVQEAIAHPDGQSIIADASRKSEEAVKSWADMSPSDRAIAYGSVPGSPRQFGAREVGKLFNEWVYNGIVNPTVIFTHGMGSTASSLSQFPERVLLSGADAALHAVGITAERRFTLDGAVAGLSAQLHSIGNSVRHDLVQDILQNKNAWVDKDVPSEISTAILRGDYGSNGLVKTLGALTKVASEGNYPLRIISSVDNMLRNALRESNLAEAARIQGQAKGLSGQGLIDFMGNFRNEAESNGAMAAAEFDARRQINRQTPGALADRVLTVKNATGPIGTVLLPFFNTKINILKAATTWSPLGFARLIPKEAPLNLGYFGRNTLTEADRVQAVTRAAVGTMAIYPLWQSIMSDDITGAGPSDPKEKALWIGDPNSPSHLPYAMRMMGKWVTYNKVPVFGDYLGAIADSAQSVKEGKAKDVSGAQAAVLGLIQNFAGHVQPVGDALDTVASIFQGLNGKLNTQELASLANDLSSRGFSITPFSGLIRADATVNDPNYHAMPPGTKGLWNQVGQRYRGQFPNNFPLGDPSALPAGAPRIPGDTGGVGALLPYRVTPEGPASPQGAETGLPPIGTAESDRLVAQVKTFKPLALPSDVIGKAGDSNQLKLRADQYMAFARYVGEARNTELQKVLTTPGYQNATDTLKARLFESAITRADDVGREKYLENGVLKGTDPNAIRQQAVLSVHALSDSPRDAAQWVALMDKSGKLTPDVRAAIDASRPEALPGQTETPTVDQYLKAAPLVTKYLSIPPYLIGNPQEWVALSAAKKNEAAALNQIKQTASNLPTNVLTIQARQTLAPQEQQLLARYQNAIVNPMRKQMLLKDPWLGHFLTTRTQAQPLVPPS